jgi:FkbM family methyltransferase
MALVKAARNLARAPLLALLEQSWLRRRLIFELKQKYYPDLHIAMPLEPGLVCPVVTAEYWHSFSEMFLERTYNAAFENMPLPTRWIDLGCHAGYFSLFVIWQRKKQSLLDECQALLVDGDERVAIAVEQIIELNKLHNQLQFHLGAIGSGPGFAKFALRDSMSSAVAKGESAPAPSAVVSVPILSQNDLMQFLSPPYDLIKVDIEGAEYDLFRNYKEILQKSKYLLVEWHSWHDGGGGKEQIIQLANDLSFKLIAEPEASHAVTINGKQHSCGTLLLLAKGII